MADRKDKTIQLVANLIGEGVHTGLRKWCESPESHNAWIAIRDMPSKEWSNIALELAKYIVGEIWDEQEKRRTKVGLLRRQREGGRAK